MMPHIVVAALVGMFSSERVGHPTQCGEDALLWLVSTLTWLAFAS